MTLFNRNGAESLRQQVINSVGRGEELPQALLDHFNKINSLNLWDDKEIELLLLKQKEFEVNRIGKFPTYPKDLPRFTPSSAESCNRQLFFKSIKANTDEQIMTPWQKRWVENSTGVHEARQRNLLYGEKFLKDPDFKVERISNREEERNGLPAWEKSLEDWKVVDHNGVKFTVHGMMDGIINYKDGSRIGFEFKTKSNSVAQIKSLKEAAPSHKQQCVAYSILFGVDEYIITYEAVAKDKWNTHDLGRPDMKAFYFKVTERDRQALLDKWAKVTEDIENGEIPQGDLSKCLFCPFKSECKKYEGGLAI